MDYILNSPMRSSLHRQHKMYFTLPLCVLCHYMLPRDSLELLFLCVVPASHSILLFSGGGGSILLRSFIVHALCVLHVILLYLLSDPICDLHSSVFRRFRLFGERKKKKKKDCITWRNLPPVLHIIRPKIFIWRHKKVIIPGAKSNLKAANVHPYTISMSLA